MADAMAACAWGRAGPSRSRTQGAAFGGAKGKPEDAEMRSAMRVIQVCGVMGSVIGVKRPAERGGQPIRCRAREPERDGIEI
jgi:hypothetical protein